MDPVTLATPRTFQETPHATETMFSAEQGGLGLMKSIRTKKGNSRPRARAVGLCLLLSCALALSSLAAPPIDPLPAPYYSFDVLSPKVIDPGIDVDARSILELEHPDPRIVVNGDLLGMVNDNDELDALAPFNVSLDPIQPFAVLFSVDRETAGYADPEPALVEVCVPYNVTDQAGKGQAAGDIYISTDVGTLAGGFGTRGISNNSLVRNNYNEGGTDQAADPPTSAKEDAQGAPQDDLDASSKSGSRFRDVTAIYFSASGESPSLLELSGAADPSGANVFYYSQTRGTTMFATCYQLGLQQADDIDAMIVLGDDDGVFDFGEQVLFSLGRNSPTLSMMEASAADVFMVTGTEGPPPPVDVFASADQLGLNAATDNIDALDFVFCDEGMACAESHGIRCEGPPIPTTSEWGVVVLTLLLLIAGSLMFARRRPQRT